MRPSFALCSGLILAFVALSACGDDSDGGSAGGAAGQGGKGGSAGASGKGGSGGASGKGGSAGAGQGGQGGSSQAGSGGKSGSAGSPQAGAGGSAQAGKGGSAGAQAGGSGGSAQSGSGGSSQAGQGGSAQAGAGGSAQAGSSGQGGSAQAGGGGASAGCGKAGAAVGADENATIQSGGKTRSYVRVVPASYDASKAYPLIFGFHGLNADGKGARGYLGLEGGGAADKAIFVYPSSEVAKDGWYMKENEQDVAFFDALLGKMSDDYCVDPERVFAVGFSHGAMFSNNLTCWRADKLRAIAPIGGSGPWFGSECTEVLPALLVHGKQDPTVPFTDGEGSRDHWRQVNACSEDTKPYMPDPCVAYQGCTNPVIWCPFDGGHTVPPWAGAAAVSFFLSFP